MAKFRKKPVVIEAIQLTERNISDVMKFIGVFEKFKSTQEIMRFDDYVSYVKKHGITIYTLEDGNDGRAKHVASIGDYIIKGVQGEFYPCKPDIFKQTYDFVSE